MNSADALLKTLIANGLEVVFANPGTSEMHLVAAIDHHPKLRTSPVNKISNNFEYFMFLASYRSGEMHYKTIQFKSLLKLKAKKQEYLFGFCLV